MSDSNSFATNDLDQETAKKLLSEGATLLIEGMFIGSEFGIDMNVFSVAQKFRGVKMIPPGIHFIYYSARSKEGLVAPRTGFFHFFKKGELLVKKWDVSTEDVVDFDDDEQVGRYRSGLADGTLDAHLGAYQFQNYNCWIGLTDYINESVLRQINPKCGKIKAVTEFISKPFNSHGRGNEISSAEDDCSKDSDGLPNLKVEPNSVINFIQVPKHAYPEGSTPSEVSKHSIDLTYTLDQILSKYDQQTDVLGEFQFAFVTFLVGQVYEAFEQWKSLLKLMCASEEAMTKYSSLYLNFIRVLHFQIKEVPSDLFVDIVENNNFLVLGLRIFFANMENDLIDKLLKERAKKFKENLTKKFRWDFSAENDDEEPVIVETNE